MLNPVPQESDQRTVEQNARLSVPIVQEQTIVQENLGTQVVERSQKQKQIAEVIPQERVQRTIEQNVRTLVPTLPAQMPKSLDRLSGASETEEEAYWYEYVDQMGPEQVHQDLLLDQLAEQMHQERGVVKEKEKEEFESQQLKLWNRSRKHNEESSDQEELDRLQHDWWSG